MKFNKKILMFGLPILALAIVSAVLVGYLSNSIQNEFSVTSPLLMTGDTIVNSEIYTGGKIEYTIHTENLADFEVWSFEMTEVTAPEGTSFSGDEFTSIIFKNNIYPDGIEVSSLMKYVKTDGSLGEFENIGTESPGMNVAHVIFDNGAMDADRGYLKGPLAEFYNDISITTSPALAEGDYKIVSCHLYDIQGDCPVVLAP